MMAGAMDHSIGHHNADGSPDADLLAQIIAGSSEARDALYCRYGDRLFRYAVKLTNRDQHAAEEFVQGTFCNFLDILSRDSFVLEGKDLSNYLFSIVRYLVINERRNSSRRNTLLSEKTQNDMASSAGDPARLAEKREATEHIRLALSRLKKDEQHIIVLRLYEGRPFEEIGAMLGISGDAAIERYRRAMTKLKSMCRHISGNGEDHG